MARRAMFMTPGEAAQALGMSTSGVRWMVDVGRMRATRTSSGRRLIALREVERVRGGRTSASAGKSGKQQT
jgi:excisionase family DNA binding protein